MFDNEEVVSLLEDIKELLIDTNDKLDVLTKAVNDVRGNTYYKDTISDICEELDFISISNL